MKTRVTRLFILSLLFAGGLSSTVSADQQIVTEFDISLNQSLLNIWYPLTVDTACGGFLSDFDYAWKPNGPQNKMIVTQTRHLWTTSEAALFTHQPVYREYAIHGYRFLKEKMWDDSCGGFYTRIDRKGHSIPGQGQSKMAYGNAFAIYSLAAYFHLTQDSSALELAQETFHWLDRHSYDAEYKGYLNELNRDGSWTVPDKNSTASYLVSKPLWKDYNTSIHLLEAFTELYKIWPDSLLRARLEETLSIIQNIMVDEKGYLKLYFTRDWKHVSYLDSSEAVRKANSYYDHVSFGHDVETAYLMLEASSALGRKSDPHMMSTAVKLMDHALANGWDKQKGGFYEAGYYFNGSDAISIINSVKTWWVEAEGMNALLLMSKLFPDDKKYSDAFQKQWTYIKTYLIDHEHGGWYMEGLDISPDKEKAPKAYEWKVNYHTARTLMNCIRLLKGEHELL